MLLLKKLAEIYSPSGKEKEMKDFVKKFLEEHGYEVYEQDLFLIANPRSDLIVATHLDTVSKRSEFKIEGDIAYGTGVADAKASIAAILEASKKGLDYSLAFFCDEEENGSGSKEFVRVWERGRYAVVMEPTQLKIALKHFGCLEVDLFVKGYPCHASMPEHGINAVEKALKMYLELSKKFRVSILKIEGGTYEYVIPEFCFMRLDFLLEPGELQKALEELKKFDVEMKILEASDGFYSKEVTKILVKAIELAGFSSEYTYMPSWTDAINLSKKFDVVVWGPGELKDCHTEREKISIREIEIAKDVLIKLNDVYKTL
ncbi:MAG: M20/M25/M40 family metallo-hydrolase [Archaeoglobaceae archaeon]|nr:M20/M25/M40 family metallo-hydrolase [Archaeoglobaceae archaeon]MCX8151745.1 M20/M25/M40 family metallo-hydrolase [Archaeoglobaceae archaeon]MDW8014285.1 M20/M25/M40 family metallo-hydrolase [Archaeoglobaceae archaeon]